MSKKTLALIIFPLLLAYVFLSFALRTLPRQGQQATTPSPTSPSVNAHTVLTLSPASGSEVSELAQHTIAVMIDTGDNKVNSVQLELAYDPHALTHVVLIPGTFFTQPSTLANTINTVNGHIFYALAERVDFPGKSGKGTLALLSFDIAPTYTDTTTTISFLPKTAVAADRILESVLKK